MINASENPYTQVNRLSNHFNITCEVSSISTRRSSIVPYTAQSSYNAIDKTCGPTCTAVFAGSLQNRTSNLKRRLRAIHHQGELLKSPEPGCEETYGRSDNLREHLRTAHNIEDPVMRAQIFNPIVRSPVGVAW